MNQKISFHILSFLIVLSFLACDINKNISSTNSKSKLSFDLEVDKLGDYYIIDQSFKIIKFNSNYKLLYTYSNANNGHLTMVDVSNPHKILVFYIEQQIIIILDNTLSEIGKIELNNNSYFTAAGRSNDGYIWLYDSFLLRLIKVNNEGNQIEESFPASSISPQDIKDGKIYDRDNYVILIDAEKGILMYNNLGLFKKIIPLLNVNKPNIISNNLYYYDNVEFKYFIYDLRLKDKSIAYDFGNNTTTPSTVIYENNHFYSLFEGNVKITKH